MNHTRTEFSACYSLFVWKTNYHYIFIDMIEILSAKKFQVKLKATIQASGRLGFTDETAKALRLNAGVPMKFARDAEKDVLYLARLQEGDEDAFEVKKSGDYFYLATRTLFDTLGIDYRNHSVIFDFARADSLDELMGGEAYKLCKREKQRNDKE